MRLCILEVGEAITILQQIAGAEPERKHFGEIRRVGWRRYRGEFRRGRRGTVQRIFRKLALRIQLAARRGARQQRLNASRILRFEYVGGIRVHIAIHGLISTEQQGRGNGGIAIDLAIKHRVDEGGQSIGP